MARSKIIKLGGSLTDPWANLVVPHPKEEATAVQLYEYATLLLLNSMMSAVPTPLAQDVLRRVTVAYLVQWHPEIKAPPL